MTVSLPVYKPHLSFSEWGTWKICQHRWFLDNVKGLRTDAKSINLSFGTCVHRALEFLKPKDKSEALDLEGAKALFEIKLRMEHEILQQILDRNDYDLDEHIAFGKNILDHIDDVPELKEGQVVFNEFQLYEPIDRTDDIKKSFKGFIDIGLKVPAKRGKKNLLYLLDFKTCSWGWPGSKRTDPHVLSQVFLYKHFICKKLKLDPKDVRTGFVLLKKRPRKGDSPVELFMVSAGPTALARSIESIQADITLMHRGEPYEKNKGKPCDGPYEPCPYKNTEHCP